MNISLLKINIFARDRLYILLLAICFMLLAPDVRAISGISSKKRVNIQGTIKNEKGEPLPGVSVTIKGTQTATTTDEKGVFRINLPTGNETLVFTYVGYVKREIAVGGERNLDIVLQEDNSSLDEVVVVGYGTQRKSHLTAAVETINMKDIEDLPVSNVAAGLAGRVLGLNVSGGTSRPGVPATLQLRNPSTLAKDGGTTQPLYVIDGIIQVDAQGQPDNSLFNSLTQAEIESISFLKDAAAAIYGSRAANGVVLITTKRGETGAPRVNYSGTYGINDEMYRPKMLSAYDFGQYVNIMNGPYGANLNPGENNFFSEDELEHFKTINHDWLEPAWSSSYTTQHSVNASGGSERATYFVNITYFEQDGNLATLSYDRWNFRAGTDVQVSDNFKVGLQVSGNYADNTKTWNKVTNEVDNHDYQTLINTPRYIPMYVDGYPVRVPGGSNDLSRYHFYEIERLNNLSKGVTKGMTVNLNAEYKIPFVEGLSARVNYGRNMSSGMTRRIGTRYTLYTFDRLGQNRHIYDGATVNGEINVNNDNAISYINENAQSYQLNFTANYARKFGEHDISGLFSVEKAESESQRQSVSRENPLLTTTGSFREAFGEFDGDTRDYEAGSLSYIGRLNYSYADKYLAEVLIRSDASTKFAPENYWGLFYSLSAGWVISEEDFFNASGINFLKFRYSFGKMGRDDTQPWRWRQRYTYDVGNGAVFGGNENSSVGMKMEASPNRDATWSDEYKNNIGVDMRFLDNRLSANIDGFYNRGLNLLDNRTGNVPISVGGSVAAENFGEVDMFGIELGAGWNDHIGQDFTYGVDLRFSWSDNKVRVGNFNEQDLAFPWIAQPGHSNDNGVWGYDYLGMFHTQEEVDAYVSQYNITQVFGVNAENLRPGMLYYRDVRGPLQPDGTFAAPDGIIDDFDQVKLANRQSNLYNLGMTLRASYKSLSVSCVISGSFGGWAEFDGNSRSKINNDISTIYESRPVFWNDIYDPILNPTGYYPNPHWNQISLNPTSEFWRVSSFRLQMQNFNINYNLPAKITEAIKVSNARVYFTCINPMYFYNPFNFKAPSTAYDAYPDLRTYSFGLNLTF
ncbi:SusC/RagA family TonB-linked outer membrane protein [Olivibacter sp. SDN3]|uniref:SusC/RagA family TonB-linked outer membrane protein n=1 Tax=Olivibacter sp. SDN3 TaxID=2764720 RepID=UPI0016518840|nr:SusC/RagA family TonB-linked outer membrane protein [Olivibacter sp. SDN3]QNL52250.1 SusC/RagA family TonB-linked outer membrane protein [Olivibacter sp. SDN3]